MKIQENLRVISYNIHKGFSLHHKFTLHDIREIIRTVDADLVFLQEVIGENFKFSQNLKNWPQETQFEYLADSIWPHHAYGKNAVYPHGHHGNAILSKFPILAQHHMDLSNSRFEQRGLLHAVIEPILYPSQIHIFCLHLDLLESGRIKQIKKVIRYIESHVPANAPLIIAGDFNDWRKTISPVLADSLQLDEAFIQIYKKHALSFPVQFPFLALDRIYHRGFNTLQAKCFTKSPWKRLSDHGALVVELCPT